MDAETIRNVVAHGNRLGHLFVATASDAGMPHVAAAADMAMDAQGRVIVGAWFCPGTIANLRENPRIALVVWDPSDDTGSQMLGVVEQIEDVAVLDGYVPNIEAAHPVPQVERQLIVRVETVLQFSHAPHTDQVE